MSATRRANRIDHPFRFLLYPFLLSPSYICGVSGAIKKGIENRVCGKEEPTMKRAMVNILFALLVAAAEIFIATMKKSNKASK